MRQRLAFYGQFVWPHRWRLAVAALLGAVAGAASGFGVPYFMQSVFARFFEHTDTNYTLGYQMLIASLLPMIFVLRGISFYGNQYVLNFVGMDILRQVRAAVFAKFQQLPLGYFERQRSGDLISRLTADTSQIQLVIHLITKEGFVQPFILIGGVGFLTYLSIRESEAMFMLMLLAVTPLFLLPVKLIGRHLKHRGRQVQETLGEVTEVMSENLHATTEVRAFNLQEREQQRFGSHNDRHLHYHMKMIKYYLVSQPMMEIIAVAVLSAAFLFASRSGLTLSTFLAMGGALFFTIDAVKRLVRMLNDVQRSEGAFARLEAILDEPITVSEPTAPKRPDQVLGRVQFQTVHFAYTPDEPALSAVEVDIAPGTVCALVGPSGAGKSTFAKLVPRFYDVTSGAVLVDGIDVRDWRQQELRSHIGIVPQMPFLFNDTILNNLRLANANAGEAEIKAAARAAYADEFIQSLPAGYDTQVGENAVRLSGGQRQRLALARAFLHPAKILILDEATSALDSESEVMIQQALEQLVRDRTVFIIAHRFSTIQQANRILLFDNGRIVADGSHSELALHPLYRKLYENQILG